MAIETDKLIGIIIIIVVVAIVLGYFILGPGLSFLNWGIGEGDFTTNCAM
jgi:hypothetical protein